MPKVFRPEELPLQLKQSPVPGFAWHTSDRLSSLADAKNLIFDLRSLDPGKYSYPYHFHRQAEEIFIFLSGEATLRTPEGLRRVGGGDIVFFETGETGAHQLFNHTGEPCVYIDLRTRHEVDICEYPDSGKINILPDGGIFERSSEVGYFKGEENPGSFWPDDITGR